MGNRKPKKCAPCRAAVKSLTVTGIAGKPAGMQEAKKLRSLATAVMRPVRSLPERQREAGNPRTNMLEGEK
ncbi:MAG: hypothetical protein DMG61_02545 [Acidobacteria bacterium]|nr:MAG: hypothetical protein DMG61_02545 [Acidobacteriota bacterium]PYY19271.1 MAG: hypothetical protein DMG60_04910 [Acidobacteriota bacterium]